MMSAWETYSNRADSFETDTFTEINVLPEIGTTSDGKCIYF